MQFLKNYLTPCYQARYQSILVQKNLNHIPNDCYIRISRNENANSIIENTINSLTSKEKKNIEKEYINFYIKKADRYRHSYHNDFLIKVLINQSSKF